MEFRPPARDSGKERTGEEEFIFDHTGELIVRQVLAWPEHRLEEALGDGRPKTPSLEETTKQAKLRLRLDDPLTSYVDRITVQRDLNLARLEHVFPVSGEATQYYMVAFILEPDEPVLLDVPVKFPTLWRKAGKMGITGRRILLARKQLFGRDLIEVPIARVNGTSTAPTPQGIQLAWKPPGGVATHGISLLITHHRDLLAEYICKAAQATTY